MANEGYTLANALRTVTRDADLKEAFFTTPVALRAAALRWDSRTNGLDTTARVPFQRESPCTGFEGKREIRKIEGQRSEVEPGFNWHGGLRMDAIYVLHTILLDVTTVATEFINAESRVVTATTRPFNIKRRAAVAIDRQGVAFRSPSTASHPHPMHRLR